MPAIPRAVLALFLFDGASGAAENLGCASGANHAAAACARGDGGMWLMQKRQRKERMEPPPLEDADEGFTWLQGACRTASGSTGTFTLFKASEPDCRQECLSNPLCVAYEFKPQDRCESHFEAIEYATASMTDYSCYVRTSAGTPAPSPAPTKAPTPLPSLAPASPALAPERGFTQWQGACRTQSGSRGVFSVVVADGAECQRRCAADAACVAVELGPGDRCELHREAIHLAEPLARGYVCLVRGSAAPPPPAQTSAPTPPPTQAPTRSPTMAPTPSPTSEPTAAPTAAPTLAPTPSPTPRPTPAPTAAPTGAPTPAPAPSPTTAAPSPAPVPSHRSPDGFPLDGFGIKQLFPSGGAERDWSAEWQQARVGYGNTAQDGDFGASFRGGGSNKFVIGQGVMTMENEGDNTNTPRYYIHRSNENVEFTAYFWVDAADYSGGSSDSKGPTLVVRSNHHLASDATPCEARGYYVRFTPAEKTLRFLKEKYHGNGQTKYTFLRKGSPKAAFPWSQWVGLKFIARTAVTGDVNLRVYMDLTDGAGGGDWTLEVERTDSVSDSEDMYGCPHASAFGEGAVAMIRADSMNPIRWKKATLREVAAYSPSGPFPWDHSSQAVV